jgi:hypothetical protein
MTKDEAKNQLGAFFRRLGEKGSFFDDENFAKARIGEAFLGFEYDETDGVLSCQALIYRFRREPKDEILDAAFAEDNAAQTGGGRLVFDSGALSLYLQRDFTDPADDRIFYEEINRLASASLVWNGEVLGRIAEKVSSA